MIDKIIKGIKYLLDEENLTAEVIYKRGYEGDFIIPEIVVLKKVAYRVTSIGKQAFYGCKSLTSIVIPDGVMSIESYTFRLCSSLTSIVIGNGVTSIGYEAFYGCESLTSIVIGNGVTSIKENAFYGCKSLTSIVIPESVMSIGKGVFNWCRYLTSMAFNGTIAQWKGIELGDEWNAYVPARVIHCTDGEVEIN